MKELTEEQKEANSKWFDRNFTVLEDGYIRENSVYRTEEMPYPINSTEIENTDKERKGILQSIKSLLSK